VKLKKITEMKEEEGNIFFLLTWLYICINYTL